MAEEHPSDDLEARVREGWSAPPPGSGFVEALGSRLRRELRSQPGPGLMPAVDRRPAWAPAEWLRRHWRLSAELAACLALAVILLPLALHRADRADLAAGRNAGRTDVQLGSSRPPNRSPEAGPAGGPAVATPPNGAAGYAADLLVAAQTGALRPEAELAALPLQRYARTGPRPRPKPAVPPPSFRPAVPDNVPRDGLVALWLGDGNPFDSAGNHHGGAVGVSYVPDRHGNAKGAFLFNGRSGLVLVPDKPALDTDEAFTVSVWIKLRAYGGGDDQRESHVVSKWYYTQHSNGDYILQVERSGHLRLWVAHRENAHVQESLVSRSIVPKGRWIHVAGTFDRGRMKLYVNGALDSERVAANVRHTSRREYDHDDVIIGAKWDDGFNLDGAVDEVGIWKRALTDAEIADLHSGAGPGAPYVQRLVRADRIALAEGGFLLGTVLNETHTVTTSVGRFEVPAARAAGLVRRGGGPLRLVLADGQVLAGKFAEQTVTLKLSTGSTLRIPMSAIRQLGYRLRPGPAESASFPLAVLRSGDRVAVSCDGWKLRLLPGSGAEEVSLPLAGVMRIDSADANGAVHRVTFANGSTLSGRLRPEKLTLKLRLGRELETTWREIHRLSLPAKPVAPAGDDTLLTQGGDRLLGTLSEQTLTVQTSFGPAAVPAECILHLAVDANSPNAASVRQWDGVVLTGRLDRPALSFEIVPGGPTVRVPTARIASVTRPNALPSPALRKKIAALIGQLGAETHADREAATRMLLEMGPRIIPLLRKHRASADAEVRERIRGILEQLGQSASGQPAEPPPSAPEPLPRVLRAARRRTGRAPSA